MDKQQKQQKKHPILFLTALACGCVILCEIAASYFFDRALFDRIIAPVQAASSAVVSLCRDTVSSASAFLQDFAAEPPQPRDVGISAVSEFDGAGAGDPLPSALQIRNGKFILTGGIIPIDYYNQNDLPWADMAYGSDKIGSYGCGPTVMAMVVSSLTDKDIDPAQMAQWAVENGQWASRSGSYHSIVQKSAAAFGLTADPIPEKTPEYVQTVLLSGNILVALMGPGHFTDSGHFIILRGVTDDLKILVADPNSLDNSLLPWDGQLIIDELLHSSKDGAPLWVIH